MRAALSLVVVASMVAACGDDPSTAERRADQVRDAATEAGLPGEVADVLALAARGIDGTFQVTYDGDEGASVVVSQAPPDRRIDVVAGDRIVESRVIRGGVAYRCQVPEGDPDGAVACERSDGALEAPGAFTTEALEDFSAELAGSMGDLDLSVESREVAGVDATCLVAEPAEGTEADVETICVSDEGAQLLIDAGGERLVAEAYTTDVPEGTFRT